MCVTENKKKIGKKLENRNLDKEIKEGRNCTGSGGAVNDNNRLQVLDIKS